MPIALPNFLRQWSSKATLGYKRLLNRLAQLHQGRRYRKRIEAERKAAEMALKQSEARYRAIVEDQTELICRSLPDTTILFVNDAYCRYFGVQRENIIGKPFLPFIHAEDQQKVIHRIQALSLTTPAITSENREVINGTTRWVQWIDRALFDDQGTITEIQAVGRDITALKQIEAALRKSENALLQAQHIAQLGSWEVDLTTHENTWSEEVFRILELDPMQSQLSFEHFIQHVPVADHSLVTEAIQAMVTSGTPCNIEHRIQRPDGSLRYVVSRGEAVLNEQQQVVKLYGTILDITDRKQAEAALQESDTRFRQLAETVQEGFFIFETATAQYSYLNPACIEITGIPTTLDPDDQDYAKGMSHWVDNIHPDDRTRIEQALQAERQGENFDQDYRFIRPDGEIRWLRSKAFPIQDATGTVIRIVGTVEDITERKQLELALQSSETKLKNLLNSANASIASFRLFSNRQWDYEYWSEGCELVFGYTAQELLADPTLWFSRVFPEDIKQGKVVNLDSLMKDSPTTTQGEYRFFHKDGSLRWSSFQATSRPDTTSGWSVTVVDIDITDRKQAEAALQDSEELFRRAFDDAPIGISLVSPTGKFLKANTFYCEILGYTEAELVQMTFPEITHPADLEIDLAGFHQILNREIRSFQIEKRYITKQGTIIPALMRTAPIRDQNGHILYFVGHIQDIRDRLKVERMKDEFISVVSHELRTPLTSIRGALGILESGVFSTRPDKANHMLKIALNNSERLVRLVNDILDLERLQSGKVQLVKQSCQVAELMQQAIESVQTIADQSKITLSLTPLSLIAWADPDAILQTLTNLLSNAIKFSDPEGTVWLKASVSVPTPHSPSPTSIPAPNACILFSIKDLGRGIPADKLDIIFEQFQQVDVSDSRQKGGTGLGLAICRNIVQQHEGQIWVESTLGAGSTFFFTIPLAASP